MWNLPWNADGKYTQAALSRRSFMPLTVSEFIEPLPSGEGVRQLDPYGRSMQTYGYSVLPRTYDEGFKWRDAQRWTLVGVNFAKAALQDIHVKPDAPWLLDGEIATGGLAAINNPHMLLIDMNMGYAIKVDTPMFFAAEATRRADIFNTIGRTKWESVLELYEEFQQEFYDYEFYGYTYW
jgi:hypothetical protein